ncbi:hypothetical protein SHO565_67320 [Streptomyces sp. HO565]
MSGSLRPPGTRRRFVAHLVRPSRSGAARRRRAPGADPIPSADRRTADNLPAIRCARTAPFPRPSPSPGRSPRPPSPPREGERCRPGALWREGRAGTTVTVQFTGFRLRRGPP